MHFSNVVFALLMCAIEVDHWRQRHGRFGGEPMASAEREPITGGLGAEPPAGSEGRGPGQGVRGRSPPEAESFTTLSATTVNHIKSNQILFYRASKS